MSALVIATDVLNTFTITAFLAAVVFIANYTLRASWWRYAIGQTVVALDMAIVITLLPRVVRLVFGFDASSLFYIWYSAACLLLVTAVTLWRTTVINRVQAEDELPPPIPVTVSPIEE